MIINYFHQKHLEIEIVEIWRVFFAQTTASFCKNLIVTFVFVKKTIFFAENWQKIVKKM
jgi:hypothetical protein